MRRIATKMPFCAGCCVALLLNSCGYWEKGVASRPQRLVEDRLAEKREHPPAPLNLLKSDWKFEGISAQEIPEGWALTTEGSHGTMSLERELDAADYTTLFIEMKSDAGAICTLSWESEQVRTTGTMRVLPSAMHPLLNGSSHQEYSIQLSKNIEEQWGGKIQRLIFTPTNVAGKVEIRRMELRYEPDYAIRRLEIQGVVHETLFGQQVPWKVQVPEQGILETHLGFHEDAYKGTFHGTVEARILVEDSSGNQKLMYSRRLSPFLVEEHQEWIPVRVDLAEFSGEEISIRLEVDPLGITLGDWVYWGSPSVFSLAQQPDATPVILISIDTLRADHMSVYGYERDTTPKLAAWAKEEAVVFDMAITPQSWTLPAHMSMFTGLIPPHHNVTPLRNLQESVVTLAEQLRNTGYMCAGFTGHYWWLLGHRGFAHGFDVYDTPILNLRHIYGTESQLQNWLDGHPMRNQFIFFHCYDVHSKMEDEKLPWTRGTRNPYHPGDVEFHNFSMGLNSSSAFRGNGAVNLSGQQILLAYNEGTLNLEPEEHELIKALYDDSICMVDQTVYDIFESLKRRGLYEGSLIIITSDHGENLGENKQYSHLNIYEEEVHVPLLVRFPSKAHAGTRYEKMVSTVSIYPTIMDVLGLNAPHKMDGPSLLGLLDGKESPPEFTFVGRGDAANGIDDVEIKGVRTEDWKLRWDYNKGDPELTLFDVHEEPFESTNHIQDKVEIASALGKHLEEYLYDQDEDGWQVLIQNNSAYNHMNIRLGSKGKIVKALISRDDGALTPIQLEDDGTVHVPVNVSTTAKIILQMEPMDAGITLDASASLKFSFVVNDTEQIVEGGFTETFAPGDVGAAQPNHGDNPEKSTLSVWYETADDTGGPTLQPSVEMEENLKALGYLE